MIEAADRDEAVPLPLVEALASDERLRNYAGLPAARADLLRRFGRASQAATEHRAALELSANRAERAVLARRLTECEEAARAVPP